jgi:hypothetical protein
MDLAGYQSQALPTESVLAGSLSSPFDGVLQNVPGYGQAQKFSITSAIWTVTQARLVLGMQDPVYPVTPALQIRDAYGAGGGPGAVLGTFSINPADIPAWEMGVNHFGTVTAPASTGFNLGAGSYWLCLVHTGWIGGFDVALASQDPFSQSGVAGSVILGNGALRTYDGGQSFVADLGGWALLTEVDGVAVPEPSALALAVLGSLFLRTSVRRKPA